ncbi:hypothetical protein QCD70_06210 [Agreia sp. PsM10]|uniref:hypothetical protein n=1 Tax=Agreia sp. PsM10 TaxID=3030533 RepID=UPI00263A6347|nr:hypothetical protein [Agreia sp. PsM10]MDN4639828.1 hypothetical protein [Agreia sp. PsM10]
MTESPPRRLRVALISFMTAASGAGLLIWAMIGTAYDSGATYINLYLGFAYLLFLPSLFAGMVAALGATAAMNRTSRCGWVSETVRAGLGAFVAYTAISLAVMWGLTQGLFPAWITLVSAFVLGSVASAIVYVWRRNEGKQFDGAPNGNAPVPDGGLDS